MTTMRGRSRRRSRRSPAPAAPAPVPPEPSSATPLDTFLEPPPDAPALAAAPEPAVETEPPVETVLPERRFAARVPPPEPERPRPTLRRVIFVDVENSSRAEHVERVLAHLDIDRVTRATELCAVGNWRVVSHDTARLLARHGAELIHSAPATGVRDWSDLRIGVAAGVWLAAARPGDMIEIVTDDQAFDVVGDVARSLGVEFRRLSYRVLAAITGEEIREEPAAKAPRSRRRRRGGRRGQRRDEVASASLAPAGNGVPPAGEAHTAPHDELLAVARELLGGAPERTISIDALSNALKARGFRRTPGSPRLITRLRRIKELDVGRNGAIRLVDENAGAESQAPATELGDVPAEAGPAPEPGAAPPGPRRRRRRGGRRRRGRGSGHAATASP